MEVGLLEAIRSIDGPVFLLIYLVAGLAAVAGALAWTRYDGTAHRSLPSYLSPDPMVLAYLSGRENGVKRASLFHLYSQGKVRYDERPGKGASLVATEGSSSRDPVEQHVLEFFWSGSTVRRFFRDRVLHRQVRSSLEPTLSRLTDEGLVMDGHQRLMVRSKVLLLSASLLLLGGIKLYLGLTYGRPVAFLVMEMFLFSAVMVVLAYRPHLTALGRKYLQGTREHMSWAKASADSGALPEGVDPVLLVALFGAGALLPVAGYHDLSKQTRSVTASGGCGGYVGSSGCGGGNGGGCGGGGCGGCGGGGCGG